MITIEWAVAGIIILMVLDLLIAATRVSLLSTRPLRLLSLRDQQSVSVDRALKLIENPRLRSSLRLSQTLARFFLAGMALLLVQTWLESHAYLGWIQFGILLLAALVMLVSEFALEARALGDPEIWALRLTWFGTILVIVMTPFVVIPLLLLRSQDVPQTAAQVTEDELKSWAEADDEPGTLEREERQMIYSIFQFSETLAREIMVPRLDMIALDVETDLKTAARAFLESGHSRLPVYDSTVDDILGLLYAKDLLQTLEGQEVKLRELLRPAYFVPETKKADELLAEMQTQRIHMAVVVDEYGGVAGVVTLEDIVEEIIGEIQDEYDQAEELLYQAVGPDEFLFLGRIDLDDFNQILNSNLPKDEADTLAGYLYDALGRVPQGGEKLEVDGLELIVEQVTGRRIRRVRVCRIPQHEEDLGDGLIYS